MSRSRKRWGWLLLLALALASCAGDGAADPGQVGAASEDPAGASSPSSGTGGGVGGGSDEAAAEPTGAPDASTPTPATRAGDAPGEAPSAPSTTTPAGSPDAPATRPGTYEYDVEAAGSVAAFPRQESTHTLTAVVEPADADGHQRTTSTPTTDDGESGTPSEQTVAHGDTDLRLVHLLTPRGPGDGDASEFRPDPPVLLVTTTAAPGDSWSWSMTSTDGDIQLDATIEVAGVETVAVGGEDVRTLVIRSVIEFRGEGFEGTEESTSWFAPDRRLTVREESTMTGSGTFNGQEFTFESEETRVLRSLTPT